MDPICTIEGCDKPIYRKGGADCKQSGWCVKHFRRWQKYGDVHYLSPVARAREMTDRQRFDTFVRVLDSGCWEWTGAVNDHGYGDFTVKHDRVRAHRWIFEDEYGSLGNGMTVDHECHNRDANCGGGPSCSHRRCVNPTHLSAKTGPANQRAAGARAFGGRRGKTYRRH